MTALKLETADCHRAVEACIDLAQASSSIEHYRELLEQFYGFYSPLEASLRNANWDGFQFDPIWRSERLRTDLTALRIESLDSLAECRELPTVQTTSQLVGTLYVIEGAALGGRIIARTIGERLGIDATNGGAFFVGDAEHTGPRWQSFRKAAEAAQVEISEAVSSATRTFSAFENWLTSSARRSF